MSREEQRGFPEPNKPVITWSKASEKYYDAIPTLTYNRTKYNFRENSGYWEATSAVSEFKGAFVNIYFALFPEGKESTQDIKYQVKIHRVPKSMKFSPRSYDVSALQKLDRGYIKCENGHMENYVGEDLLLYLNRINNGKDDLSFRQVVLLYRKIASAVKELHERGFVHCDLKPQNLTYDGKRIQVIDLSEIPCFKSEAAAQKGRKLKGASGLATTKRYVNSKYYNSDFKFISTHTDIYALAVTFCEIYATMVDNKSMDYRLKEIFREMAEVLPSCDKNFDGSHQCKLDLNYYIQQLDVLLAEKDLQVIDRVYHNVEISDDSDDSAGLELCGRACSEVGAAEPLSRQGVFARSQPSSVSELKPGLDLSRSQI